MLAIPAGKFKSECLKLLDRVALKREEFVITKRGIPVARVVPIAQSNKPGFGYMKNTVTIHGDIVAPLAEWSAAADGPAEHDD